LLRARRRRCCSRLFPPCRVFLLVLLRQRFLEIIQAPALTDFAGRCDEATRKRAVVLDLLGFRWHEALIGSLKKRCGLKITEAQNERRRTWFRRAEYFIATGPGWTGRALNVIAA
jgi:hypothetical protein